jgi:hypothetical protein
MIKDVMTLDDAIAMFRRSECDNSVVCSETLEVNAPLLPDVS